MSKHPADVAWEQAVVELKDIEEIAEQLAPLGADADSTHIASALRSAYHRGRVAGLREAEELAIVAHFSGLAKMFRSAADKLEAEKP